MSVAPAPEKVQDSHLITVKDSSEVKEESDLVASRAEHTAINVSSSVGNDSSFTTTKQKEGGISAYVTRSDSFVIGGDATRGKNAGVITSVDSKTGKVLHNKAINNAPKPPKVHEEAYVPVSYARKRIADMSEDMIKMKVGFQEKILQLDKFYRQLEDETKNYYKSFIHVLNEKATERIKHYRLLLTNSMKSSEQQKQEQLNKIETLESERSLLNEAKAKLVQKMEEEALALRQHEEQEIKKAHDHELRMLDEEKKKYVRILSTDADKLSNTQKEMKETQAAIKADFDALSEVYFAQMQELQKHMKSLQQFQAVENGADEMKREQITMDSSKSSSTSMPVDDFEVAEAKAQIDESTVVIAQLKAKIKEVKSEKKACRDKVKKWLSEFEAKEGRPPSNDEKRGVSNLFGAAKKSSAKLKLLEEK